GGCSCSLLKVETSTLPGRTPGGTGKTYHLARNRLGAGLVPHQRGQVEPNAKRDRIEREADASGVAHVEGHILEHAQTQASSEAVIARQVGGAEGFARCLKDAPAGGRCGGRLNAAEDALRAPGLNVIGGRGEGEQFEDADVHATLEMRHGPQRDEWPPEGTRV